MDNNKSEEGNNKNIKKDNNNSGKWRSNIFMIMISNYINKINSKEKKNKREPLVKVNDKHSPSTTSWLRGLAWNNEIFEF